MAKQLVERQSDSPEGGRKDAPATKVRSYQVRWVDKVEKKSQKASKSTSKGSAGVISKRLRTSDGKLLVFRYIDANSASFGSDFDNVFRSNVRKARRDNKRIVGTLDRGLAKR